MFKERLAHFLKPYLLIQTSEKQFQLLAEHFHLLSKWNKVHNLISVEDLESLACEHYADCVIALSLWRNKKETSAAIYDLGSGNGFPGLVGGILFADQEFILVESSRKKCSFLRTAKSELGLDNVKVLQERVENLCGVESAITRAAFSETKINQLSTSFASNGSLALMTVPSFPPEDWLLEDCRWKLTQRLSYVLGSGAERSVVVLENALRST